MSYYVVMDIGGTFIKHSVMNEIAESMTASSTPTPKQGDNEIFSCMKKIIEDYRQQYEIEGIALSIPGLNEPISGLVYSTSAISDFTGKNLKEELKEFGLPIEFENDVNCVTLAEKWKGNAIDCQSFVCVTSGTGIGGGIFINGDLYRGQRGMAGEFGLMALKYDENLETILKRYSFSQISSTKVLAGTMSEKLGKSLNGEALFTMASEGNKEVIAALDDFFNGFAVGIANIIHALAPEKILIGGGISAQPSLIKELKDRVAIMSRNAVDITEIDSCYFKNDAGKIGALYHFFKRQNRIS